jgi:RHS repeat-associated protein
VGVDVTRYLLDLQPRLATVIGETVGANTTRYIHAPRGIHAMEDAAGVWTSPMQDGLGSVRMEASNALAVACSQNFAPYGTPFDVSGSFDTSFGFTGEQTDGNALIYLRARYYNPAVGVFTGRDPFEGMMGRPMSLNGYSWVEGNTPNLVDPLGLCALSIACHDQGGGGGGGDGSLPISSAVAQRTAQNVTRGLRDLLREGGTLLVRELVRLAGLQGEYDWSLPDLSEIDPDLAQLIEGNDWTYLSPELLSELSITDFGRNVGIPGIDPRVPQIWGEVDARRIAGLCNGGCLTSDELETILEANGISLASDYTTGEANTRYGDCTQAQHRILQDDVNRRCKELPMRCSPDMRCAELRSRRRRNRLCAEARERINRRCYNGGNEGHQQAAENYRDAFDNCNSIFRNKCS